MFGSPADFLLPAVYTAGSYIEAGLPNITGSVVGNNWGAFSSDTCTVKGALYTSKRKSGAYYNAGNCMNDLYFDASKSNSIYGSSDTVQPNAITARYYIKY